MFQRFTVGNPPPVTDAEAAAPPPPKLLATVGPKNTISLRSASGAALHHGVKAGTYSIVVRDRSKLHNFHLVGKGVNRKSAVAGHRHDHLEAEAREGRRSGSTRTRRRRPSRAPSASPSPSAGSA